MKSKGRSMRRLRWKAVNMHVRLALFAGGRDVRAEGSE